MADRNDFAELDDHRYPRRLGHRRSDRDLGAVSHRARLAALGGRAADALCKF